MSAGGTVRKVRDARDVLPARLEPASVAGMAPPHDMAAEGVVIAASVENSRRAGYPRDTALALVKPADFYSDDNARIWEAVTELAKSSKPVHTQSITGWLRERGITSADLFQYVHEVVVLTPAVAEVEYYALRVASLAKRRRLIAEMQRLIAEGFSAPADVDTDWCDQAVAAIEAAGGDQSTVYSGRPLLDFARSAFQAVHEKSEAIKRGEQAPGGLRTHLPDLDHVTGDLMPGNLIVIGAQTGIGKSSLARQWVTEWSMRGAGGYVLSLEMTGEEVAMAMLYSKAQVDAGLLGREQAMSSEHWGRLTEAASDMSKRASTVWIDDRSDVTVDDIGPEIRRRRREFERLGVPFRFVVVDYLQLMQPSRGRRRESTREEEVNAIGRALKNLAARERVVVVAMAQLNADADKRTQSGGRPRLSDLRESKAIAQHASKILLIHNPNRLRSSEGEHDGDGEECEIIVAKNRGGRLGPVPMLFRPRWTRFECPARGGWRTP